MTTSNLDWDALVTEIYDKISFDMDPDQVHDAIDEMVKNHKIVDPMDFLTMGIFIGDCWRPPTDEEVEDVEDDESED